MEISGSGAIGRLERVLLREVWKHEALNFTHWLQENIEVLNEALGMDLISLDREQPAGSFSVDLLAEDRSSGMVIIENQLEKSNHEHLGKLITYMVGMNAKAAIWIVSEPRPEHVASIAWLNESTSGSFYMVKVEGVRIGNSPPAALFTLIVGPSDEAKDVGITVKELSEIRSIRRRWWNRLIERSRKVTKLHSHIQPSEYPWIGTSSGVRGLNLNYVVLKDASATELYIDRGKDAGHENESIFDQLALNRELIEANSGLSLDWQRMEGKRACRIRCRRPGGYQSPEEEWPRIQDQIIEDMCRLEKTLDPHIKSLKLSS